MPEPASPETLQAALSLYRDGDLKQAEALLRTAIAEPPGSPEIWNLLGVVLRTDNRPQDALDCYRRALAMAPEHVAAWTNLGNAYKDLGAPEMAIACHTRALRQTPNRAELLHNLGIALMAARRYDEAVGVYSRALLLNPHTDDVRWDRAIALLSTGRWAEGWLDYDARIGGPGLPRRTLPGRPWRGETALNARILIAAEQGIGDAIWCLRYLPLLRRRVGRIILECRQEFVAFARAQGLADEVIASGEPLPEAELHIYQCSLPGFFTSAPSEIPPAPYVSVPAGTRSQAADIVRAAPGFRIGIVWSGSTTFKGNAERSAPLSRFLQSFGVPGVTLFSLQMGPKRKELLDLPEPRPLIDLAPYLTNFIDTAAAVSALDLVIMTDSAVAHLCGALGRPVWLLLPFNAYWLWGSEERTPWYDSVRFFRQATRGDWPNTFDAAGAALLDLLGSR